MNSHSIRTMFRLVFTCLLSLCLFACGGSDTASIDDSTNNTEEFTPLSVSLTDAEGDFLTYQVDITNITLTRSNGAVVNVLPQTTTVDFAQYVEVTELLTILDAPTGRYDSAELSLDFSNAMVTVQDSEGQPIVANVVDSSGATLEQTSVEIVFNDESGFVLTRGRPAQITLDFDLDASNTIDIDGDSATVTVNPILIADTIFEEPKPFRLRGLLADVDQINSDFDIALRPFRVRNGDFGIATIQTESTTHYEIDGNRYVGEAGLAVLSEKDQQTAVVTSGTWDRDERIYTADAVYAGTSVPWDQADILRGTVIARDGTNVTVRGAIIELANGEFTFNDDIDVIFSTTTIVHKVGEPESSSEEISVGSAIVATGDFNDQTLNASEGIIRILPSTISGSVVSASPLVLDLNLINGRRPVLYDFTGTGTSEDTDADPENYEVATSSLDLSAVAIGDPIRTRGFAMDFGLAPEDFIAGTVINAAEIRGHMVINYGLAGSTTALISANDMGLTFNVDDALFRHHIAIAGIAIDLQTLPQVPVVMPGGERGVYAIWNNRRLEVYTNYERFVANLNEYLNTGAAIVRFDAHGFYQRADGTFSSKRMGIILN